MLTRELAGNNHLLQNQPTSELISSRKAYVIETQQQRPELSEAFWTPNISSSQLDEYPQLYSQSKSSPN